MGCNYGAGWHHMNKGIQLGTVEHTYDSRTQEEDAGKSGVRDQPWLHT